MLAPRPSRFRVSQLIDRQGRPSSTMRFAILATLVLVQMIAPAARASCRDILEQGIRNTYQSLRNRDLRTGFANGLCSSQYQSHSGSSGGGGGLTIPIYGVPVGINGKYSSNHDSTSGGTSCGSAAGYLSDDDYDQVMQAVADPTIVDAWSKCNSQGGFILKET